MSNSKPYTQITEDIYQVQLPLPFALKIVNCYLLRGENGWTILDTGLNTTLARETWLQAFTELGIKPNQIEQIVVTHYHPDHFGLAGWLQNWASENGTGVMPDVVMSDIDYETARTIWWRDESGMMGSWADFWQACGVPKDTGEELLTHSNNTRELTLPLPSVVKTIQAGSVLKMGARRFNVLPAPGHTDGQIIFYDADGRLLLSGDHVLMKITPNISLWPLTAPNPLGRYLHSLRELQALDVQLALPGHRALIRNWQERLEQLLVHHDERLDKMYNAVKDGHDTPYEVTKAVFRFNRLSSHEIRFAVTETLAHLVLLDEQNRIQRRAAEGWQYDV